MGKLSWRGTWTDHEVWKIQPEKEARLRTNIIRRGILEEVDIFLWESLVAPIAPALPSSDSAH